MKKTSGIACVLLGMMGMGCGGGGSETDAGHDAARPVDSGAPVQDAGADTGSRPPDLPSPCEYTTDRVEFDDQGSDVLGYDLTRIDAGAALAWTAKDLDAGGWSMDLGFYDDALVATRPAVRVLETDKILTDPRMLWTGEAMMILWRDGRWDTGCTDPAACRTDLALARLSPDGGMAGIERLTTDRKAVEKPLLMDTGDGFLAVWMQQEGNDPTLGRLYAMPLDRQGVMSGSRMLLSGSGDVVKGSPSAAWGAQGGLVGWAENGSNTIMLEAVDANAAAVGSPARVDTGGKVFRLSLQSQGPGSFLLAWSQVLEGTLDATEVFVAAVGPSGLLSEPIRQSWTNGRATHPALMRLPSGWGLFWVSDTAQGKTDCLDPACTTDVYLTILDATGAPLTRPRLVTDDRNDCDDGRGISTGDGIVAAWTAVRYFRSSLFGRRLSCKMP